MWGEHREVVMVCARTFRKASLTLSSLIMPLRHRFSTSSALDVPELRHAMLVVNVSVLLLPLSSVGCCVCRCRLEVGLVATSRRGSGLVRGRSEATVGRDDER